MIGRIYLTLSLMLEIWNGLEKKKRKGEIPVSWNSKQTWPEHMLLRGQSTAERMARPHCEY